LAQRRFEAGITPPGTQARDSGSSTNNLPSWQQQFRAGASTNSGVTGDGGSGGAAATATPAQNPYAKKSQGTTNGGGRGGGGRRRNKNQPQRTFTSSEKTKGNSTSSSTRITTNQGRPAASSSSYSEQQYPHRTGRVRADRQFTSNLSIFTSGPSNDAQMDQTSPPSSGDRANKPSAVSLLDDDDDSDDDLLYFTPFAKTS